MPDEASTTKLDRIVTSPLFGAAGMILSALWNGLTTGDGPVRKPSLSVIAFVLSAGQSLYALHTKNRRLERLLTPQLRLVFRPEVGDPYLVDKRLDNERVRRVYRVGIANDGARSIDNVGVLLKSFSPIEKHVRVFHELTRMGQEAGANGSRFRVTGNTPEPQVFVEVLSQTVNLQKRQGYLPDLALARGDAETSLWGEQSMYKLSLVIDGDGAGPLLGLIYERSENGIYALRMNEFARD